MTINVYDKGDKPKLQVTFSEDEAAADPTAVALIVRDPDGNEESYLSSTGFSSQGNWDANGNSPALADGTGTVGDYYTVTVAGSANLGSGLQTFAVGDRVFYDGDTWLQLPSPQAATLTKESTGVYSREHPVHKAGSYYYRFEGSGAIHAAGENRLKVRDSVIR